MDYVRGSAIGTRVGGAFFGIFYGFLTVFFGWGAVNWWIGLPFIALCVFCIVRPWFVGVWIGDGEVVVKSWFRRRRFTEGQVTAVAVISYTGMVGFAVGWIPFAGAIRMLEIKTVANKLIWLPVTVARRNRAIRLAREVRVALGLKPG